MEVTVAMTGATIAPIDLTGIETETEIGTGIGMAIATVGTHGETGRIWN